ncbi:hypothetical protein BNJ_00299 [Kaumoebavirus]|nr:hypothetical protein BNJ_00299 [Kaumoebavirus]ARA72121.1 hypothetical protein BNJ_00299 [Kaumoebavirus]
MRRHYLEPVKKTEEQIALERLEFLLDTHTEDELHAKRMQPDYSYRTFT